jgi:hypothetical protein
VVGEGEIVSVETPVERLVVWLKKITNFDKNMLPQPKLEAGTCRTQIGLNSTEPTLSEFLLYWEFPV